MLPTTAWIVLTYSCNNRCCFCYAKDGCSMGDGHNDEWMDYSFACNAIQKLARLGVKNCLLIGGEPTLYPDIVPLVSIGAKCGVHMKLVSNGRKLADYDFVLRLKEAGLIHSSVSLEAAREEKHNFITQTSSFAESLQGAKNLLKAEISANSIMTISTLNVDDIVANAILMHSIGMPNILYNFSLPSIDEQGGVTDSFALDPRDNAKAITEAYLYLKRKKGIHISFFATLPLCLFPEEILDEMREDMTIGRDYHCHIYYGTGVAIEPNGDVLPCTHFVGSPLFNAKGSNGELVESFEEQWEYGIHLDFVKEAWHYPAEACEGCKYWGKCFAGCPFIWTFFEPKKYLTRRI